MSDFFSEPFLNSLYEYPNCACGLHGQPTQQIRDQDFIVSFIASLRERTSINLCVSTELKTTGNRTFFVSFEEPNITVRQSSANVATLDDVEAHANSIDTLQSGSGDVRSDCAEGITYWLMDTDDEQSFFVRHEYTLQMYRVQSSDDFTSYAFFPFDSEVERDLAEKLDPSEAVRFFCKLLVWFKILTPLGDYNADWAVVLERDTKLYLIRETKDTNDRDKRSDTENRKIDFGRAHFRELGVDYDVATNIQEVLTLKPS